MLDVGPEMIGKLTSVEKGPKRNVKLRITPTEVYSEISSPGGACPPESIVSYEITELAKPQTSSHLFSCLLRAKELSFTPHSRGLIWRSCSTSLMPLLGGAQERFLNDAQLARC